jgi:putative FmdB family regulatory protein
MPIYEYRCLECHQDFEEWCKHAEDDTTLRSCPICKGHSKRLISHTTFALKGGGWYATEYGARKNASSAREGDSALSSGEAPLAASMEEKTTTPPAMASGG